MAHREAVAEDAPQKLIARTLDRDYRCDIRLAHRANGYCARQATPESGRHHGCRSDRRGGRTMRRGCRQAPPGTARERPGATAVTCCGSSAANFGGTVT